MKNLFKTFVAITIASIALASCKSSNDKLCVILDTDIGNDVDDVVAMDLLYKYMDAGTINLLAINTNQPGAAAEFADIMNTWYGYPDIPIGKVDGNTDKSIHYSDLVVGRLDESGNPLYPRSRDSYQDVPEGHILYRQILSKQKDNSVVIASVGFSTNLANLLDSPADEYSDLNGYDLVAKKVKTLVIMAGDFEDANVHEFNVVCNIPAAQKIFSEWPSEVVASPFELGLQVRFKATSIENDFNWTENHPLVDAYVSFMTMPYDREMWDPTAVVYAVEGDSWFTVSEAGKIEVTDEGSTIYTPDPNGNRRYLSVTEEQAESLTDHIIEMATAKPAIMK